MDHSATRFRDGGLLAARIAATWLVALDAPAAPYLPTNDAQVLERLPGGTAAQLRELRAVQAASAHSPRILRARPRSRRARTVVRDRPRTQRAFRAEILRRNDVLFEDAAVVREFERFFRESVARSASRREL